MVQGIGSMHCTTLAGIYWNEDFDLNSVKNEKAFVNIFTSPYLSKFSLNMDKKEISERRKRDKEQCLYTNID